MARRKLTPKSVCATILVAPLLFGATLAFEVLCCHAVQCVSEENERHSDEAHHHHLVPQVRHFPPPSSRWAKSNPTQDRPSQGVHLSPSAQLLSHLPHAAPESMAQAHSPPPRLYIVYSSLLI